MNRLRWSVLPLVAISVAFGQTEDQYRQFIAHVQNALALKAGAVVADIGTGDSPEHPLHISKAVGETGKVICVDINQKALETLRRKLDESGTVNVQTQLGKPDDPMLPVSGIDAVLISFAYHELVEHEAMLAHIRSALRPDGRLVVIEAISENNRHEPRERQIKDHELSPDILSGELTAQGLKFRMVWRHYRIKAATSDICLPHECQNKPPSGASETPAQPGGLIGPSQFARDLRVCPHQTIPGRSHRLDRSVPQK